MQYSDMTAAVIAYIKAKFDSEPEFLWAKTPNNAAFRYRGNRKWFGALLMDLPGKTLGLPEPGRVDVLNLKCDPRMIGSLVDGERYLPGYHMNKEHWISVLLDGSVPADEIFLLIDMSYSLISEKKRTPR